jgi:RNA polymerase sigma-70 factor
MKGNRLDIDMLPSEMLVEIREIYARCQRTYPTIDLPFDHFQARLTALADALHPQHAAAPGTALQAAGGGCAECSALVRQLHHEDLYLASACARGDRIAWEYFADQYLPQLKRLAAYACRNLDAGEDLAQELMATMLGESAPGISQRISGNRHPSGGEGNRGKLQSYTGRGSLSGWLRAAISHAAIDRFRRARKQTSLEALSEKGNIPQAQDSDSEDGAEEQLDSRWGPVLIRCVHQEITKLSARDRLLLRLYYLEGVSLQSIGSRYGVHEATASRWLERARRDVRKRVEHELRKIHGLSAREVGFLWHWALETANPMLDSVLQCQHPGPKETARRDYVNVTHMGEL